MAIIDERFRKMLMMDYATKEGQNNQGFFGSNLTGGLLSNLNPSLLIGADIIGSGIKGKDPFSSLVPALARTAQIKKTLTPKQGGQSIRFNPQTGEFEITSGGAKPTSLQEKNSFKARDVEQKFGILAKTIPSLQQQVSQSKTGAVGAGVKLLNTIGDQFAQIGEINTPKYNRFAKDARADIQNFIQKSGLAGEAQDIAKIESSMTNLAYTLASIAEPGNPKYSEGDIQRQFDRIKFGSGSRDQIIAGLQQVLEDEFENAQAKYKSFLPQGQFGYSLSDGQVTFASPMTTQTQIKQPQIGTKKKKDKKNDPFGIR